MRKDQSQIAKNERSQDILATCKVIISTENQKVVLKPSMTTNKRSDIKYTDAEKI